MKEKTGPRGGAAGGLPGHRPGADGIRLSGTCLRPADGRRGLEFALTALFAVLFLEQWKHRENRRSGGLGLACAALSLAVFGPERLVIPAMVLILAALLGGRKLTWLRRLCKPFS